MKNKSIYKGMGQFRFYLFPAMVLLVASGACYSEVCTSPCCAATDYKFNPLLGVRTSITDYAQVEEAGFDYIEEGVHKWLIPDKSDEEFAKNFANFKKSSLPIRACNGFLPTELKSVGPDADHDGILKFAEVAFKRAKKVGVTRFVFGSGGSRKIPEGFSREKAKQQFVDLLKRMGPIARKYDVVICIEPLNKKECNLINYVKQGTEIVRLVNDDNVKVLADFYHMALEDEGPESIIDAGEHLYHCHIAEEEGRMWPGFGKQDFRPYFVALKEIKYEGGISLECKMKDAENDTPAAYKYLKAQIASVNGE